MLGNESAAGSPRLARAMLVRLASRHSARILVLFLLATAQTMLSAAAPWLVGLAIDVAVPAARAGQYGPFGAVGAALLGCAAGSAWLGWLWRLKAGEIGQLVVFNLRQDLFAKLQRLPVAFHDRMSSGRVIARLTSDVEAVNVLFGNTLATLLNALLVVAVTTVTMLLLDIELALVTFLALLPVGILTFWSVRRLRAAFSRSRAAISDTTVHVVESLNGVRAVHAFRSENHNDERFAEIVERSRLGERTIQALRGIYWPAIELVFSLAALAVVLVGGLRVTGGTLRVGVLAAFVLYVAQFFGPLAGLTGALDALQSALTALGKLAEVMAEPLAVAEPATPVPLPATIRGEIVFEHVRFGYPHPDPGANEPAQLEIPGLDLHLRAGETVAMLGATGAGKSTIAKLIARFYDPLDGRILLDGIDLREIADRELRRSVVLLTQEGFLFAGSVADNIRVGKPSATRAEIEAAARAMGANAFIEALPEGYDTDIRKRGTRLSAGQRQMVAFARAFLADPAVLILDEATSALDIPTERAMQAALKRLLAGRTALIIAHRLSTVEIAHRVLVIADGHVVDDGTPADLLARGTGEFAALYRDAHGLSVGALHAQSSP